MLARLFVLFTLASLVSAVLAKADDDDNAHRPHVGMIQIEDVSGQVGATDEGVAAGGAITVSTRGGSEAELDVVAGQPILRIRGETSIIPLQIVTKTVTRGRNQLSINVSFVPLTGDTYFNVSSIDHSINFDAFLRPTLSAEVDFSHGPIAVTLTARVAPVSGGVVYDSQGPAVGTMGANAGVDASFSAQISQHNRIDLSISVDKYVPYLGSVSAGPDLDARARFVHTTNGGAQFYVGVVGYTERLDIIRRDQPITGDTRDTFVGGTAGVSW